FANRRAADAEFGGKLDIGKPTVGSELAFDDFLAKQGMDIFPQRPFGDDVRWLLHTEYCIQYSVCKSMPGTRKVRVPNSLHCGTMGRSASAAGTPPAAQIDSTPERIR